MRALLKVIIFSLILMSTIKSVFAQTPTKSKPESEQTASKDHETDSAEAKSNKEQADKNTAGKNKPPKKVFKPTEEISEDRPVPFPVDI